MDAQQPQAATLPASTPIIVGPALTPSATPPASGTSASSLSPAVLAATPVNLVAMATPTVPTAEGEDSSAPAAAEATSIPVAARRSPPACSSAPASPTRRQAGGREQVRIGAGCAIRTRRPAPGAGGQADHARGGRAGQSRRFGSWRSQRQRRGQRQPDLGLRALTDVRRQPRRPARAVRPGSGGVPRPRKPAGASSIAGQIADQVDQVGQRQVDPVRRRAQSGWTGSGQRQGRDQRRGPGERGLVVRQSACRRRGARPRGRA